MLAGGGACAWGLPVLVFWAIDTLEKQTSGLFWDSEPFFIEANLFETEKRPYGALV
jgi:hypothetical protein